ncbi:MAG: hypothetical protein IJN86_04300, partial [Clostridia bacterium]|nr:hypothetical protein [Clostridia bacterium]
IVVYGGTFKMSGSSKIYKNEASNVGGGVHVEGAATLDITGSSTVGATNIYENTADYRGGGIHIYEPSLDNSISIKNVTINGNIAKNNRGGGLYVNYHKEDYKNFNFYMENAIISNNEADTNGDTSIDGHGGGIYLCACVATFKNCTFSGNSTNKLGGGLYATQWMVVSMSDCTFSGNSVADGGNVDERGWGGGLYAYQDAKITAVRCTFTGNSARSGAAIGTNGYIYQGVEYLTEINLVDCSIGTNAEGGRNTASRFGGGIYSYSGSKINIVRGAVQNNGAENGAGIYVTNSNVVLNISDSTDIIDGFSMEGVAATGDGTVISDNDAHSDDSSYGSGGGIYCGSGTTLSVTNAKILSNSASNNGGGVAISSQLKDTSKTVFTGTEIDGNTAGSKGGGIMFYWTSFTLNNCIIGSTEGNSVTDNDGGGICVIDDGGVKGIINDGQFNKNEAYHGGAIYTQAELEVSDVSINGNHARGHGGGIYTTNELTAADITVEENSAQFDGGGLCVGYIDNAIGTATISGSNLFKGNTAMGYGGGMIAHSNTTLNIVGTKDVYTTITENKLLQANKGGAGVHVASSATFTMTYGKITDNHADKDASGNAISSNGAGLDITGGTANVSNVEISGNMAGSHGGGIRACRLSVSGNLTVTNCEIKNNVSGELGGGVSVYGATANITGTVIDNNQAKMGGGIGISVSTSDNVDYGSTVEVTDSYITNNDAVGSFSGATTAVSDAIIPGAGGGVAVSDKSTFKMELNNKSGAIYGNTATTAGDDVFSNGINTDLTIPQPEEMDTTGFGAVKAYWFEDYMANDSQYTAKGLNGGNGTNNGRYNDALVAIRAYTSSAEGTATNNRYINDDNRFVAITFGIEKFNVGSIKITAPTVADTNQMFVFVIHGTTAEGNVITVDVSVKAGQTVEVSKLMAGEYTVVMDADWSWRYTVNGITVDGANKGTGMVEVDIVGRADEEHTVVYTAATNENKWLTHNSDRKTNTASSPQVVHHFDMAVYDERRYL